jgi:hypothetical protein
MVTIEQLRIDWAGRVEILVYGIGTLLGHAVGTPLSNRWAINSSISSDDRAASYKRICQIRARLLSTMWRKDKETTF